MCENIIETEGSKRSGMSYGTTCFENLLELNEDRQKLMEAGLKVVRTRAHLSHATEEHKQAVEQLCELVKDMTRGAK